MKELYKYFTLEEYENIYNEEDSIKRAEMFVEKLFLNRLDKSETPYINHLLQVKDFLEGENSDLQTAGLLHDVLEDIEEITEDDLRDLNFSEKTIELVKGVTNEKNPTDGLSKLERYHNKITNIIKSKNEDLIKLKYADMRSNLDEKRLSKLTPLTRAYLEGKYLTEICRLKEALNKKA